MTTETLPALSSILWSSTWLHLSWRITALPSGHYRTTASRQSQIGHVQLESSVFPSISDAWCNLASRWLSDTATIYDVAERRFRADLVAFMCGRRGFRPGSSALRQRAEQARDDLYGMARSCGRDWLRLREIAGNSVDSLAIPEWLDNAIDDLAQPDQGGVTKLLVPDARHDAK